MIAEDSNGSSDAGFRGMKHRDGKEKTWSGLVVVRKKVVG